jgi:hypothetical protein
MDHQRVDDAKKEKKRSLFPEAKPDHFVTFQ